MAKSPRIIFSASPDTKQKLDELTQAWGEPHASGVLRSLIKRAWREMKSKEAPT